MANQVLSENVTPLATIPSSTPMTICNDSSTQARMIPAKVPPSTDVEGFPMPAGSILEASKDVGEEIYMWMEAGAGNAVFIQARTT